MAVDQPHAPPPHLRELEARENGGRLRDRRPVAPLSMSAISLSADDGMTGQTASASMRMATTNVPNTSAIRLGSLFLSTQGAAASIYWLHANTAPIRLRGPRRKRNGRTHFPARRRPGERCRAAPHRPGLAGRGKDAVQFLKIIDRLRWARLPKLLANSALTRLTIASLL